MAKGVQGNQAAQARMFAHDAVSLVTGGGTLNTSTIANTSDRGVCLYIGIKMASIVVTMESGNSATFKGVNAVIDNKDSEVSAFFNILMNKFYPIIALLIFWRNFKRRK